MDGKEGQDAAETVTILILGRIGKAVTYTSGSHEADTVLFLIPCNTFSVTQGIVIFALSIPRHPHIHM